MRIYKIVFYIRILAAFAVITHIYLYLIYKKQTTSYSVQKDPEVKKYNVSRSMVLVIIVCPLPTNNDTINEATALLKSIIISAKLYQISPITIYFFVENMSREKNYFIKKIYEFGYPFSEFLLNIHFRSAVNAVPQKYRNEFIMEANNTSLLRCTNVRFFIQSALPREDAILYLDTDIVIHGNLFELWNAWNLMDENQLIGVASDYEEGSDKAKYYKNFIYPFPRYLNAGVLLMNLTRMREFDWERKSLRIWNDYKYTFRGLNDQSVINMLLRYNSNLLYRLPCHFNFMHQHCELNGPCKTAKSSSVQIFHGAGGWFTTTNALRDFYLVYSELNVSYSTLNSNEQFRTFVQNYFNNSRNKESVCHSTISEIIKL